MSVDVASARRDRFGHRKEGTGRNAANRQFDLRGPRSGWVPPSDVRKDADGFDNIDSFFGGAAAPAAGRGHISTVKGGAYGGASPAPGDAPRVAPGGMPQRHLDFSGSSPRGGGAAPALSSAAIGAGVASSSAVMGGMPGIAEGGYDDVPDIGMAYGDDNDEDDEAPRAAPVPVVRKAAVKQARGKGEEAKPRKRVRMNAEPPKRSAAARYVEEDAHGGDDEDDDDADEEGEEKLAAPRAKKVVKKKPTKRQFTMDDDDDDMGGDDADPRSRDRRRESLHTGGLDEHGRPKRRRWKPLAHWAGEHVVYQESGAVQAVRDGVLSPDASSKRARKVTRPKGDSGGAKGRARSRSVEDRDRSHSRASSRSRSQDVSRGRAGRKRARDEDEDAPAAIALTEEELEVARRGTRTARALSPERLPAGVKEAKSPSLLVPGQGNELVQIAVFRHARSMAYEKLPITTTRASGYDKPAQAGAALDSPQFISGTVRLKPRAMKDEESTHNCTQVFTVLACQPRGLQVEIAQNTYFLSPGDHFYVPQGTVYRLTNHSVHTDAEISFVVIKPTA